MALSLAALLLWPQAAALANSYVDVLDMPARMSALAVTSPLLDITRAGDRLISVGQRGHILYSDDAGQTWQQAQVPVSADLNAVHFPTADKGWVVGNDGVILHSSDAGQTWTKQLDGRAIGALLVAHYGALAAAEPENEQWPQLVAEGERLTAEGADKPFLDVWFSDTQTGFAVGVFNLILHTRDGGQSWQPLQDRTGNPQGLHLNAIAASGSNLYIAGEQGLLRKWDAVLERFIEMPTPYQGSFFGLIGEGQELLVFGLRGNALRSQDGGWSWEQLRNPLPVSLVAALRTAQGQYRLFSQGGHLLSVAGNALQPIPQAQQSPVAAASLASDGSLVVAGMRGVRRLAAQ
jgi:photosystem II stability/assembly factor-like uncharacterized protein